MNIKIKHNIHRLSSALVKGRETIHLDKYLIDIEREFKTSKSTMNLVYLYNLRDTISKLVGHFISYEKQLEELSGKYLKFSYNLSRDNDLAEYKKQIKRCNDISTYLQYANHWRPAK